MDWYIANVLCNIPIHQDIPPKDGANKADIVVYDKKSKPLVIFELTGCNVGEIHDRHQRKTEKYLALRSSLKRMNSGHKITQVIVVFDFLSRYYTNLIGKLCWTYKGPNIARKCQKWFISQYREIVKRLYN